MKRLKLNLNLICTFLLLGIFLLSGLGEAVTPLQDAVRTGNADLVRILLENGAEVDTLSPDGITALHLASGEGYEEIVALLINHGAEVDVRDSEGFTPLHYAVESGNSKVVKTLVSHGADVNSRAVGENGEYITPLYIAIHLGRRNLAGFLKGQGAIK